MFASYLNEPELLVDAADMANGCRISVLAIYQRYYLEPWRAEQFHVHGQVAQGRSSIHELCAFRAWGGLEIMKNNPQVFLTRLSHTLLRILKDLSGKPWARRGCYSICPLCSWCLSLNVSMCRKQRKTWLDAASCFRPRLSSWFENRSSHHAETTQKVEKTMPTKSIPTSYHVTLH